MTVIKGLLHICLFILDTDCIFSQFMVSRRMQSAAGAAAAQVGRVHVRSRPAGLCSGTSSCLSVAVTYSPAYDPEGKAKEFKFARMEKENAPDKKEAEKLVMSIDSGKPFICTSSVDTAGECKYHTDTDR